MLYKDAFECKQLPQKFPGGMKPQQTMLKRDAGRGGLDRTVEFKSKWIL